MYEYAPTDRFPGEPSVAVGAEDGLASAASVNPERYVELPGEIPAPPAKAAYVPDWQV